MPHLTIEKPCRVITLFEAGNTLSSIKEWLEKEGITVLVKTL